MSPHPTALLGLVLCLAQTIHTQEGPLPRPSISAEPGTVIPLGRPVTIVCRGPVGVHTFRLEREDRSKFNDTKDVSQASPSESVARFRIDSVSEGNAGRYRCLYRKSTEWSQYSDYLELVVKGVRGDFSCPFLGPLLSYRETEASAWDVYSQGLLCWDCAAGASTLSCLRLGLAFYGVETGILSALEPHIFQHFNSNL
uniref:Immunoglobulin domain-containing protein n=1 Tax=Papio anubis TaxID=9555 RepID=A0A8I5NFT4_PAPAN